MYELIEISDPEFEDLLGQTSQLKFYSDGIGFLDLTMKPARQKQVNNKLTIWTKLGNKFTFTAVAPKP